MLAVNPENGEALTFSDGQWVKAPVAHNPDTGDMMAFDGKGWQPIKAPAAPNPAVGKSYLQGLTDQAVNSLTPGLADEMSAGAGSLGAALGNVIKGQPANIGGEYDRILAEKRADMKQFAQDNPVASTAANLAGGLTTGGMMAKGGASLLNAAKPTFGSMIARGAGEGAIYGGLHGFGSGEGGIEDRAAEAGKGATLGAVTGGAMGAVGAKMADKAARSAIPTTDQLKSQANAAYDAAENAGLIISKDSFKTAVDDIAQTVKQAGIDRTIHPKASAALNRLMEASGQGAPSMHGGPPPAATDQTLKDVDILRRVVKGAAKSTDPDERRIAGIMAGKLDEYMAGLQPGDVVAGDAKAGVEALTKARDLWSRFRKGDVIEEAMDAAKLRSSQFSGSGYENALRTEFRKISGNTKLMRGFSDEEQGAIRKVAEGGAVENALRYLGKLAPTGIVSGGMGQALGYTIGSPFGAGAAGAVAVPAIGLAARQGATAMTARNAQRAADLMRAGGTIQRQPLTPTQKGLLQALIVGEAEQLPQMSPASLMDVMAYR